MQYDFDQVVDRTKNLSAKYDERVKKFGTDDVIPLWIADMDFRTAQPVIDALKARAEEGIWGYTARPDSYFEAIRGWQKRRNGWDIDQSLMSFSLGVVQTLSACVKLFTPEGGSVLIQTPVYSEFYDMTEAWNRKVLENQFVEKDGKWTVDWADFEEKLKQADLFLLCSPHNPLGHVWTEEELRRIAAIVEKYNLWIVSDEIHCDLIRCGRKHIPMAKVMTDYPKLITCMAPSKTFNLAGLAFSNIIIRDPVLRERFKERDKLFGMVNPMSLTAAKAAYDKGGAWHEELKQYLDANFAFVKDFFDKNLPDAVMYIPEATYLAWVDLSKCLPDVEDLPDFFANKAGVLLEGGNSLFVGNAAGYIRLNLAMPRSILKTGLERMRDTINAHNKH